MAVKKNQIAVEITAVDEATPKIERLEKRIDGLEADEARITVTAQTDRLEQQLADARTALDGLDGDQATVQARMIGTLETELEQAQSLLTQLDGKTGTVHLTATDTASGDIDKVARDLRALDGETADVKVRADTKGIGAGAKGALAGLGLGAAFVAGAQDAAAMATEVNALAGLTGETLENTSRLTGTFATSNVEASDLADIMLNVNQVFRDNPELAKQLGVEIDKNTSLVDIFVQTVDAIGTAFDNDQDRAAAFSQFFGEEGARQVAAVVEAIDTDLATALEQFKGPIITEESVENARKINTELAEMEQRWQQISLAVLPIINGLLEATIDYFGAVNDAGNWWWNGVANAGGDTRRFLEGIINGGDSAGAGLGEAGVIARNTAGFHGGAPIGPTDRMGSITNVFYPPGVSPPVAGDAVRRDDRRNGIR